MFGPVTSQRRGPPARRASSDDVVGHEAPRGGELLDHGVAPSSIDELERVVDLRAHEVVAVRHLGERARDVPLREALRRPREAARPAAASSRTRPAKSSASRAAAALLGVGELVGERVELVAREALAGGDRLLAPPRRAGALSTWARVTSMYQPKTRV